jgi:hypothetical protein
MRAAGALVLAALLPALAGCFLFGGGDDKKEKKQNESLMDASTGAESGTAPAPGATPEVAVDRGPSQALPIAALVVSGITLISMIVHSRRRHRPPDPER